MSRRHRPVRPALLLATAAAVTLSVASSAGATTASQLKSAQAQARDLEAKLTANRNHAEVLDEQYLEARQAIADANTRIAAAAKTMAVTEARAAHLRSQLGDQAALLYMGAGNNDPIGIDVTSVQDLGSRSKYSEAAASLATQMLGDLTVTDEQLRIEQQNLQRQRVDAQKSASDAAQARQGIAQANASIQQLLRSTNANVKQLEAEIEHDKQVAEANAEKARLAAIVARAARVVPNDGSHHGRIVGITDPNVGVDPGSLPAPNPGAAAAIAYARSKIGDPYVYAGAGPNDFDCSGLTMMAWAQGGVSMSHGSQAQYDAFPHVPIADLQPGDLVFFGSSGPTNHHVGLFVGGGTMIEAPFTGAVVRYSTIYRPDLVPLGARP